MNFQKEKEDDLELLLLEEELFLLFFFDDPPPCDPANRCMLDVFDFFATAINGHAIVYTEMVQKQSLK